MNQSHRWSTLMAAVVMISLTTLAGCGGSGGGTGGGGGNSTPAPTASITASPSTITLGSSTTLTVSTTNATSCSGTNALSGSVTTDGTLKETPSATGTVTYGIDCSGAGGTASSSVKVTVNAPANAVTSVSLSPSTASINDYQPLTVTPTVTATGTDATTVNLSVSPSSAGTLSATSNVASGTAVTFTPAGTGAGSATITATSTADSTKSATATVTITLRKISISIPQQIAWLPDCGGVLQIPVAQTGMEKGDTLYAKPLGYFELTSTPGSTFSVGVPLGNTYSPPDSSGYTSTCSPGAYDFYVTGTDGAESNHQYLPVVPQWNQWAGYNSTDEFVEDYAGNQTCKFNLSTGKSDGCIPVSGFGEVVDGANIMSLGGTISVNNTSNGSNTASGGDPGDQIADFAAKNGMVGYTAVNSSGEEKISFFAENTPNTNNVTNYPLSSGRPEAITMTEGCGASSTQANAFVIDEDAPQLLELRATQPSTTGGAVGVSSVGSVALSKFAPVSSLPSGAYYPYYVSGWDNSCVVAVLAPVLNSSTGGGVTMQLALIDASGGTLKVLGYDNSTTIPASAIEMAPDPAGNAVIIDGVDETNGTSPLVRVSWTLSGSTPTFTTTTLSSTSPTGVYCVGLGVTSTTANGDQVSCSQRDKLYHVSATK